MTKFVAVLAFLAVYIVVRGIAKLVWDVDPDFWQATVIILAVALGNLAYQAVQGL